MLEERCFKEAGQKAIKQAGNLTLCVYWVKLTWICDTIIQKVTKLLDIYETTHVRFVSK